MICMAAMEPQSVYIDKLKKKLKRGAAVTIVCDDDMACSSLMLPVPEFNDFCLGSSVITL